MTFGMVVRLPVTGTFGSDEDFDLRTRLERDFNATLLAGCLGECGLGETDAGSTRIHLEAVSDPDAALCAVKGVLTRYHLLDRATVTLEAPSEDDPDDIERQVLWPAQTVRAHVA